MSELRRDAPVPLADLATGPDEAARAGEALRGLPDPPPFDGPRARRSLARIHARLEAPARRTRWPLLAVASLGALAIVVGVIGRRETTPLPIVDRAAGSVPRMIVITGSTDVVGGRARLRSGRLLVQTMDEQGTVDVVGPRAERVVVPPRSLVEIDVRDFHVKVSAYRGTARVSSEGAQVLELVAGRTLEDRREGVVSAAQTLAVQRLIAEGVAESPPTESPPTSAPDVAAVPTPPSSSREAMTRVSTPTRPARHPRIEVEEDAETIRAHGAGSSIDPPAALPPPTAPVTVEAPPPVVSPAEPSALAKEASVLERAVRALRHDHDATTALRAAEEYLSEFPRGMLRAEATLTHIEALLQLDRRSAARALERTHLEDLPRAREFAVVRGELRAEVGRCRDADRDFAAAIEGTDALAERAIVGRADCRSRRGDEDGARAELERYLERFPGGQFAVRAKRALRR